MSEERVGEANAGLSVVNSPREVKSPSLDALRFVHNWIWEHGETEMWPAANLRDAARLIDAFSVSNPTQSNILTALKRWKAAEDYQYSLPIGSEERRRAANVALSLLEEVRAAADSLTQEGEKTDG